jgi:cell fate regulator YaaT (PSP1 superfamily)
MSVHDYLVSYGRSGDFGRFHADQSLRRGDAVVLRSERGLELGTVLCPAAPGHAPYLARTAVGEVLRLATEEDQQTLQRQTELADRIFADGRRLAGELGLPLEILDVEVLLEGRQVVLHHLRPPECDPRALVSTLSRSHNVTVLLQNLALPQELHEESHGCGKPGCGSGAGGCSSCGSGGGCSTCGTAVPASEVSALLAGLHPPLARSSRTPLL